MNNKEKDEIKNDGIKENDRPNKRRKIIKDMVIVALFFALLTASTFIRIPMPLGDYLTLQLEIVILIGFIVGPKLALATTSLYVFAGLAGLPVFAAGGGIQYVFKASFGYIYGFVFAAFIVGLLSQKMKNMNLLKSISISILGILIIYACGYIHKYLIYNFYLEGEALGLKEIILATMSFEVPKDLVLGILCGLVAIRLRNVYQKIYQR